MGRRPLPRRLTLGVYHVLGIDPNTTLADFNGRPQYLLEDREPIQELL